jgi:hypothetical protein
MNSLCIITKASCGLFSRPHMKPLLPAIINKIMKHLSIILLLIGQVSFGQIHEKLIKDQVIHLNNRQISNPIKLYNYDYIISISYNDLFENINLPDLQSKFSNIAKNRDYLNIADIINLYDTNNLYQYQILENIATIIIDKKVTVYNSRHNRFVKKILLYKWIIVNISTKYFFIDKQRDEIIFDNYEKVFIGVPSF